MLRRQLRDILVSKIVLAQDAEEEYIALSIPESYMIAKLLDDGKPLITNLNGEIIDLEEIK